MRKQGVVVRWDDARGFGFIRSAEAGSDVFFHVRDYRRTADASPRQGLAVTFEEIHVGGKGPRGMSVQAAGAAAATAAAGRTPPRRAERATSRPAAPSRASGAAVALPLMLAYAVVLAWSVWSGRLPWWVLAASFLLNVLTFFAYWRDKYAAGQGQWRTSEPTLHLWSLAGGWPGAWFAQQVLRHKSVKKPFRTTYWATVVIHCATLAGWLWRRTSGWQP
jgi:uncharacterized membrane protein YsdA (DUF1294 family)/cold shock CspA family protein